MNLLTGFFKSATTRIACHCMGSAGLGVIAAVAIAFGIIHWATPAGMPDETVALRIELKDDGEMLKKLSAEILEGTDVAGEETPLADIAPAAGSDIVSE
jgi:hypothetical protein